ncbi:MAG: phosphoribosylglycinamide formyltransferase [Pseudomonadota bacterium]
MAKARIAVLISGRGSNMAALIYAAKAKECPFEITLVASNNPDALGLKLAHAEGIATFAQSHKGVKRAEFDMIIDAEIRKSGAEYVALAGYMRLLSPEFVAKWQGRMLNIHPSLLPEYKGLDTHERALADGASVSGCSVHLVTAELDDGPVLGQTEVAIISGDTPDTLADRILIAEHQLYSRILSNYVVRENQPDWILAKLDTLARALPETEQRPSHGSPGWRVGGEKSGKYFAYFAQHHHGEASMALLVKTSGTEEQTMLIEQDEALYYLPQYYGASGWIGIRLDLGRNDWDHLADWLRKSWMAVAPAKLRRSFSIADEF